MYEILNRGCQRGGKNVEAVAGYRVGPGEGKVRG